jgi:hypothetical protein
MNRINRGIFIAIALCALVPISDAQVINTNGLQQVTLDQVQGATTYWLVKGPCPSLDGSPPPQPVCVQVYGFAETDAYAYFGGAVK